MVAIVRREPEAALFIRTIGRSGYSNHEHRDVP